MNKQSEHNKLRRAVRAVLIDASQAELKDAVSAAGLDYGQLAARGLAVAQRALASHDDAGQIRDLHRGLGALVRLLRRKSRLSVEELAAKARINPIELRNIESDPDFDPNPRTIVQLEHYFKLPPRSLVILSGAIRVEHDVQNEALRFAASSEDLPRLTQEEKKLLNEFVRFLGKHTDE